MVSSLFFMKFSDSEILRMLIDIISCEFIILPPRLITRLRQ